MLSRNAREGRYAGHYRGHWRSNFHALRNRNKGPFYIAFLHPSIEDELRHGIDVTEMWLDEDVGDFSACPAIQAELGRLNCTYYYPT